MTTPLESIREKLLNISIELTKISKELKNVGKEQGKTKKSKKVHERLYKLKPELSTFLGIKDDYVTRQTILKQVSKYVKDNGLQNKNDKCSFNPDKAFSDLFKIEMDTKLTFLSINSLISPFIERIEMNEIHEEKNKQSL